MFEAVEEVWSPVPPPAPMEPDDLEDLAAVPIETIEARVCTLAGHLAAATCRWLLLLGEFDHRNGWSGPGIRSCAQWLSWRCGLSMPAARQHVRVARALRGLPRVVGAFAAGQISYSKVRSITRIATATLEGDLVELALTCTAAQLDAIVATYRRTEALSTRPSGRPVRSTTWHWDEDGCLVVRSRLAPEEGALYLAAIEAMQAQLSGDDPAGSCSADRPEDLCEQDDTATAYHCSHTDAVVAMAEAALAAGPVDATGSDRYEVVIHADLDQLLADPTAAPDQPNQPDQPKPSRRSGSPGGSALHRGRCHLRGGPCIHPATLHRLACDAAVRVIIHGPDGSPKDAGRRQRLPTGGLRRLLTERDGGRCQFPGCHHTKFLHAHHIVHWAHGGNTDLDNLILLCSLHHRLLHEHGYTINVLSPGLFAFHRPDGTRIDFAPGLAGQPGVHQLPTDLHIAPAITEHTTTPTWAGEHLDLGYVVSLLFPPEHEALRAS